MRLGKNKKKQWRRCVPGIEDEIIKANQLKEIGDASFSFIGEVKKTELKYSTVPRTIVRKHKQYVKHEVVDVWADNNVNVPVLSKRRAEIIKNMSRYKKPAEIIHSGMSVFPKKKDHEEFLEMLEKDQILRIKDQKKHTIKESDFVEKVDCAPKKDDAEEEGEAMETDANEKPMIKKVKCLTTKQRKQRLSNLKTELHRQKQKSKEKNEAHALRNISRYCKEIKVTSKQQKEKLEQSKVAQKQKQADKIFKDQIKSLPFQLPSELAPNLRTLTPEGDLLAELCDLVKGHKFKADKPKKMKKLTKMVKKKGLV